MSGRGSAHVGAQVGVQEGSSGAPERNKTVLRSANAAVLAGDHEGFLAHCTDDVEWTFVGERTLTGKDAVRRYLNATYREPPRVTVAQLIAEGGFAHGLDDRHGRAPPVAGRLVRVRRRPRGVKAAPRDAGLQVAVSIGRSTALGRGVGDEARG